MKSSLPKGVYERNEVIRPVQSKIGLRGLGTMHALCDCGLSINIKDYKNVSS